MAALALHALAFALLFGDFAPSPEPEPRIFPIRLVSFAEPAAAAQEPAQPAARPAPPPLAAPPPRVVQKPAPPPKRPAARPPPAPVAEAVPATTEPAPAAPAALAASTGAPAADVASGPLGPALGAVRSAGEVDEIAVYVAQVRELLARYKRYPALARRRGLEGDVRLLLRIAADGSVESARADGDAAPLFARSALDAIERAGRFPSPPRGAISIEVPMRFRFEP